MDNQHKKRQREKADIDIDLVEIYEDLSSEAEDIRLAAAHRLLSKFCDTNSVETATRTAILARLFRGLCSGRKAARIGFSVALTDLLSQIFSPSKISDDHTAKSVLDLFERQTTSEGKVSGQDERDHAFGRLFGASAIVESHMLVRKSASQADFKALLDIICDLASRKPWLREACGLVLLNFLASTGSAHQDYAEMLLDTLVARKMVRTPEAVAIWVQTERQYPEAKLPTKVWKNDDPLQHVNRVLLAEVLRDVKPSTEKETQSGAHDNHVWSPQLHFVWGYILRELELADTSKGAQSVTDKGHRMDFSTFWAEAIEHGLLDANSSAERKHWGMLLLNKVIGESPPVIVRCVFTDNVVSCLMAQLASSDRNLHYVAAMVMETLQIRVAKDPDLANAPLLSFLGPGGSYDFDRSTNTKVVEYLIKRASDGAVREVTHFLKYQFLKPGVIDEKSTVGKRQGIVDCLVSIFTLRSLGEKDSQTSSEILRFFVHHGYFSPRDPATIDEELPSPIINDSTRNKLQSALAVCLEHRLKGEARSGTWRLYSTVLELRSTENDQKSLLTAIAHFEGEIQLSVDKAWTAFNRLQKLASSDADSQFTALALLYSLTLLQAYAGDTDAIPILEDLQDCYKKLKRQENRGTKNEPPTLSAEDKEPEAADIMTEIVLTYSSKPSKLFRRATHLVFQTITSQITSAGLDSLLRVLQTKESIQGQRELFDEEDDSALLNESGEDSELGSDVEMADADIEAQDEEIENDSLESSSASHSSDNYSNRKSDQESSDTNDTDDPDLAAFDAKLAAALRTNQSPSASGSSTPSSIASSQIEALDAHLSTLFRSRLTSSTTNPARQARNNITSFKNRVIDLLALYFRPSPKSSNPNPLALVCLPALLSAVRSTRVTQLRDRTYNLVEDFCHKAKRGRMPLCPSTAQGIQILQAIHDEARKADAHRHSEVCGKAAVLVIKAVVRKAEETQDDDVLKTTQRMDEIYDATARAAKGEGSVKEEFFKPWRDWVSGAKSRWPQLFEGKEPIARAAGRKARGVDTKAAADEKTNRKEKLRQKKSRKSEQNRRRKERLKKMKTVGGNST